MADQHTLEPADARRDAQPGDDGGHRMERAEKRQVPAQQRGGDHASERDKRTHRQVDAAGDDDESLSGGDDADGGHGDGEDLQVAEQANAQRAGDKQDDDQHRHSEARKNQAPFFRQRQAAFRRQRLRSKSRGWITPHHL